MRWLLFLICTVAVLAGAASAEAGKFIPAVAGKKIVAYGWDWPNTAYVRKNVELMEKQPFDGIVIGASKNREPKVNDDTFGIRMFTRERLKPDDYQHAIDDLKATHFHRFTDNFIQTETMPGDIDYFNDADWDTAQPYSTFNIRC